MTDSASFVEPLRTARSWAEWAAVAVAILGLAATGIFGYATTTEKVASAEVRITKVETQMEKDTIQYAGIQSKLDKLLCHVAPAECLK
jgi:hypothetical protein